MTRTAAVLGAGTIGLSWAALFAAHGFDVRVQDPRPDLQEQLDATVAALAPLMGEGLGDRITVAADLEQAAGSVELAAGDIADLSADLAELQSELGTVRDSIDDRIESTAWRLVLAAMLGWLAIPAAVSLLIGLRWLGVRSFRR